MAKASSLYTRIQRILESARTGVARTVNSTQVLANWLIGWEIVEEEQKGRRRAGYGHRLLESLSARLRRDYGSGYSVQNLRYMRQFYLSYPRLISQTPSRKLPGMAKSDTGLAIVTSGTDARILHALRGESAGGEFIDPIRHTACGEFWSSGLLHPNLSWSLYRQLLKVNRPAARAFYEIEAIKNNWSARELERQIASLLFDRLARSRDKKGLLRLATKGQEVTRAADAFKDPVVMEFLGLPASPRLVETDLEEALITKRIFASRYQLHLPTEAELQAELRRELRQLRPAAKS